MTQRQNRPASPVSPYGAETFDLDDFDGGGAHLELESAQGSLYQDQVVGEAPQAEPWPTGISPEPGQYEIDPGTVDVVAGYGRVPRVLLDTPLYAFTVVQRRLSLKRRVRELQLEFLRSEEERDERLARLAEEHHLALAGLDGFRRVLAPLQSIQELATERRAELKAGQAQSQAELARFDAELEQATELGKQAASKLAEEVAVFEARERDHQRAVARLKRIHIERRAIAEAAKQAAPPGTPLEKVLLSPEQSAKLSRLEGETSAAEAEVEATKRELEAAQKNRTLAQSAVDAQGSARARIERSKQKARQGWEAQISTQKKGVGAAEQQRRDALLAVSRQVLATRALPLDEATLDALRAFDAKIDRLGREIELHALALAAYDRTRFRQGIQFPLAALGGLLVLIFLFTLL